jgi:hypothetical protein
VRLRTANQILAGIHNTGDSMEPLTADGLVTRNIIFHTLLVFRAPTTLSEALAVIAAKRRTSLSAVIRDLLVAGLASEEGGTRTTESSEVS